MSMRKPLIAGNWKMFKTGPEAEATAKRLAELVGNNTTVDVMIAPPFTALALVARVVQSSPVALGAQNLYWETEGPFTGEISAGMLKTAGCTYAIIGHSERRQYFGESDERRQPQNQSRSRNGPETSGLHWGNRIRTRGREDLFSP